MGWAKYEEDNREVMEERWTIRDEYRSTAAYCSDYNWRKQIAARKATIICPRQKVNTSYSYRTVR